MDVEEVAAGQHGVITRRQAQAVGLSPSAVTRRLKTGRWRRTAHAGVFVIGWPDSWRQRLCAAVLAGPAGTVASHRSAAILHGLRDGQTVEVTVPRGGGRHAGLTHHLHVPLRDRMTIDGIPTTRVERTLIDLAAVVEEGPLEHALEAALRLRLTTVERIVPVPGREGAERLRLVLAHRSAGGRPTGSDMEVLAIQLLRAAGLPPPVRQYEVRVGSQRYFPDLAYPERRLAIELDGFEEHGRRAAFESDRGRQNALVLAGWMVLRFTWADVTERPGAVVAAVARALAA